VRDFPGGVPKGESPSTDGRTSQADPSGTSREGPVLPKRESAPSGTGLLRGSLTPLGTGREAWYSQRESWTSETGQGRLDSQEGVFALPQRPGRPRQGSLWTPKGWESPRRARTALRQESPLEGIRQRARQGGGLYLARGFSPQLDQIVRRLIGRLSSPHLDTCLER
jgi:hypothetical protein